MNKRLPEVMKETRRLTLIQHLYNLKGADRHLISLFWQDWEMVLLSSYYIISRLDESKWLVQGLPARAGSGES